MSTKSNCKSIVKQANFFEQKFHMMKQRQLQIFPKRKNNEGGALTSKEESNKELVKGEPNPNETERHRWFKAGSFGRANRSVGEQKLPPRSRGGGS